MNGIGCYATNAAARMVAGLGLLLALSAPAAAEARQDGAWSIEVLVDGAPLAQYTSRGTTYIEALEGREYSIRLHNNSARRVAIALSVDGLNSIDARSTTARQASKWILDPYRTITIDGWQTGPATARRFFFTTEEKSYGAWIGKTRNLGIITAAVFRERRPRPVPIVGGGGSAEPGSPSSPGRLRPEARQEGAREGKNAPADADEFAATGIGKEVDHRVTRVSFEAESEPAAVLGIRYEYRDALVHLGVLPRPPCDDPLARREGAEGFDGMRFAPDPFPHRCP